MHTTIGPELNRNKKHGSEGPLIELPSEIKRGRFWAYLLYKETLIIRPVILAGPSGPLVF